MNELHALTPIRPHDAPSRSPLQRPGAALERGAIQVTWARHQDEVREAQHLRFTVFAAEMGARLTTPIPGHDVDLFDDFCLSPFHPRELEARLKHLFWRTGTGTRPELIEYGDLVLNLQTLEATRGGQPLHLYPAGRKILEVLMRASPAVVARERLEAALWGDDPPDGDMLRSHVYELRRAVDGPFQAKLIQTVTRTGYRIAVPDAGAPEVHGHEPD